MAQVLVIKHKGLQTAPNEFSSIPEGSLLAADNCSIDDDNILEPRRGFLRLQAFASGSDRARRYAVYQSTLIAAYSNGKIAYDNAGTWTNYTGTYNDPDSLLARLRFLAVGANLYFTTSAGVYRLDAATTGTPTLSGIQKGLDIQLALTGSSGFLATANQVAYRVVWGFRDANGTVFLSAPSGRAVIINASGGSRDVNINFTIPSGITTSHFFQVYRSAASGGVDVEPSEELGLVYENNPTAGEITAGVISTYLDSVTDDLRGATLYTSPSQEGALQANERPPLANDINFFQNCTFYADCKSKHRKQLTILSTASIAYNDTLTIAGTAYTAKGTETIASGFYSLPRTSTTTGDTTNLNNVLTNVASTAGCKVGWKISGTNIPASTYIGSFTSNTITMVQSDGTTAQNATGTTAGVTFTITPNIAAFNSTSSTPAQNIAAAAESLIRVINRYTTNTLVYATLLSGPNDLPGQILIEERAIGGASFAITASANGTSFNPVLPTSGTTVSSSADDYQHQLFFSKTDKPESVPLLNYRFVGSQNNRILRIMPLKNSLFIFKEREGIYRLTGTDPTNFTVDLFDSSARLLAPDSVDVVNNQIWGLSDQGVITITETGVSVISRPIEDLILEQTGLALNPLRYYSFGVGYETDRKYILWTVSSSADTNATQAFVWNTFTRSFTRWDITATTAIVSSENNKLHIGEGTTAQTLQERKTLTYADFVDYAVSVSITAFSGTSITLNTVTNVEVGDILSQSSYNSIITAISGSVVTVADTITGWSAASASVLKSYQSQAEYAAVTGGNPGMLKQFPEVSMLFRSARFNTAQVGFATDVSGSFEDITLTGNRTGLWGLFPWGQSQWGSMATAIPIRTFVPLEKQYGALLRVRFTIRQGYSAWQLNGLSIPFRETGSMVIGR